MIDCPTDSAVAPLPLPTHFQPERVGSIWRVPYGDRAAAARAWADRYGIRPAATDRRRVCLLLVDVQNTFCLPEFELFVAGPSGNGAIADNDRLCQFVYRNLGAITEIVATLDTHGAMQVFHPIFWTDSEGRSPLPLTTIAPQDVESGRWRPRPEMARQLVPPALEGAGSTPEARLEAYALHYVRRLSRDGKYPLTIWPYHAMLGGVGHALVSAVEEAAFFHSVARYAPVRFEVKGDNPLTENYSVLRPEVLDGPMGTAIAGKNSALLQRLLAFDAIAVAGQAKSHCVAWTLADLLDEIRAIDPALAEKVYLLEDCTSPVVVPGTADFTAAADRAFDEFAAAGMNRARSTETIASWFD